MHQYRSGARLRCRVPLVGRCVHSVGSHFLSTIEPGFDEEGKDAAEEVASSKRKREDISGGAFSVEMVRRRAWLQRGASAGENASFGPTKMHQVATKRWPSATQVFFQ